jgi:ATP synthase protein I
MTDTPPDTLEHRVQSAKKQFELDHHLNKPDSTQGSMSDGARAGIELVGGLIGGGILGFALDKFFDTSPILFILFLILGVMTGFYNIYKITQNMGTSVGFKPLPTPPKNGTQGAKNNYDEDEDN